MDLWNESQHERSDLNNSTDLYHQASNPVHCGPPASRKRRARTQFDYYATERLESVFAVNQYPDVELRDRLADQIGVSEARIQTWFQNKRSRSKRRLRNSENQRTPSPRQVAFNRDASLDASSSSRDSGIETPKSSRPKASSSRPASNAAPNPPPAFRAFYRDFLSPSSSSTNQDAEIVGRQSSSTLTQHHLTPPLLQPGLWLPHATPIPVYPGGYHAFPAAFMSPYLPPTAPLHTQLPPMAMHQPFQVLPSSLLLQCIQQSPNNSPDSTSSYQPQATSTPVTDGGRLRCSTVIKSEPHCERGLGVRADTACDSEDEVCVKVQDSGYASDKSDIIDVCS